MRVDAGLWPMCVVFTAEDKGGVGLSTEEGGGGEGAQAAGEEEQRGEAVTWRIKTELYIYPTVNKFKPLGENHTFLQKILLFYKDLLSCNLLVGSWDMETITPAKCALNSLFGY